MSDGIDMDGAIEALSAELPDELESPVNEAPTMDETVVTDNPASAEAESFTGFDPSVLPEDMQQVYKSMQADYTRKTQEVAELRRSFGALSEQGVDPDVALQAVGFLQELNTNPDFAKQVAEEIQRNVGTPDVSQPTEEIASENNVVSYEGLPPQLAAELEEMRAFREEMLSMQAQQESLEELEAMEQTIRTSNPQFSDDDMEAVYALAYSHDGDLMAAAEQYHAIQQRLLGQYLQAKQVPHGATPAPSAPSSTPNRAFTSIDEAHKAAMEAIRNIS
jgi:hypothetical protein